MLKKMPMSDCTLFNMPTSHVIFNPCGGLLQAASNLRNRKEEAEKKVELISTGCTPPNVCFSEGHGKQYVQAEAKTDCYHRDINCCGSDQKKLYWVINGLYSTKQMRPSYLYTTVNMNWQTVSVPFFHWQRSTTSDLNLLQLEKVQTITPPLIGGGRRFLCKVPVQRHVNECATSSVPCQPSPAA